MQQALKKARQFEVRKIVRRLKEAKGDEAGAPTGAGNAAKLQQQLEAARGVNISSLTAEVQMPARHSTLRYSCQRAAPHPQY